jgi:hypothetical protein
VEGYSATYYHLAPEVAHRETPNRQEDAYKAADQIEDLMKQKEKVTMHCIVCWEGYDLLAIRQQLENRKREMRRQGCVINRHTERFDSSRQLMYLFVKDELCEMFRFGRITVI